MSWWIKNKKKRPFVCEMNISVIRDSECYKLWERPSVTIVWICYFLLLFLILLLFFSFSTGWMRNLNRESELAWLRCLLNLAQTNFHGRCGTTKTILKFKLCYQVYVKWRKMGPKLCATHHKNSIAQWVNVMFECN